MAELSARPLQRIELETKHRKEDDQSSCGIELIFQAQKFHYYFQFIRKQMET